MCLGIPGRIVRIDDHEKKLATVDVSGVKRQINIACVVDAAHPVDACVGDWVLVHVGFAMSRINEAEAAETLKILADSAPQSRQRDRGAEFATSSLMTLCGCGSRRLDRLAGELLIKTMELEEEAA